MRIKITTFLILGISVSGVCFAQSTSCLGSGESSGVFVDKVSSIFAGGSIKEGEVESIFAGAGIKVGEIYSTFGND